jgi:hypothetical protein
MVDTHNLGLPHNPIENLVGTRQRLNNTETGSIHDHASKPTMTI